MEAEAVSHKPWPVKPRFLSKVLITDKCWLWQAQRQYSGYGRFYINGKQDGAHRASWMIFKGRIPKGKFVLHKCDVKPCVNPHHLWIGTPLENTQDMMRKGRGAIGEKQGRSKLTALSVIEIRKLKGLFSSSELSKRFHVTPKNIRLIWSGTNWAHLL